MEAIKTKRYPIGIQTFSEIREEDYLYIDKTEYVYYLAHSAPKYTFLSRPRRFGKSLLTSTLQCYFEGRKELFKGLAIEQLEKEWTKYPVLHFDMSQGKHRNADALTRYIIDSLKENEDKYQLSSDTVDVNLRLKNLIKEIYRKTGQKVVVLFDEYDAPLLDVAHEEENLPGLRDVMRNFYSPLKACDPYLRFVFFTGITKFSQLSIFSELNNITNISMDEPYAGICGITKEELLDKMSNDIYALGCKLSESDSRVVEILTSYYDGYHFTWPSPDVFNPFSLLTAFDKGKIEAYWFESGTPTFIINLLKKYKVSPSDIGNKELTLNDFNVPVEEASNYYPVLYQSGYLTIKGFNRRYHTYVLDIPNQEVRLGLMRSLIPNYITPDSSLTNSLVVHLAIKLDKGDMNGGLSLLQTFLGTIPYCDNTDYEGHYQQILYIIFTLLGAYVDVEVHTSKGRIDLAIRTASNLYIMELKLNGTAQDAFEQIDIKKYPERFALCGLPITKVGVNFSTESRNIGNWVIG